LRTDSTESECRYEAKAVPRSASDGAKWGCLASILVCGPVIGSYDLEQEKAEQVSLAVGVICRKWRALYEIVKKSNFLRKLLLELSITRRPDFIKKFVASKMPIITREYFI